MREYLFRGKKIWHDDNGWVEGFLTYFSPDDAYINSENGTIEYTCPVDLNTVGQYIGRKDRNGKNIFEGDIVKVYPTYMGLPEKVGVVCYNEDSSSYQVNYEYWTDWVCSLLSFQLEIVGNTYDNPEMWERKENKSGKD